MGGGGGGGTEGDGGMLKRELMKTKHFTIIGVDENQTVHNNGS